METSELSCVINSRGRFINSTKRFARRLSIIHSDIEWRYFIDCFRNADDWKSFNSMMLTNNSCTFKTKLRNRKRRSFDATLICTKIQDNRFRIEL